MIRFEWDSTKASLNQKKHGVSFEEAQSVFHDEFAVQFFDDESAEEDRFILLGISNQSRVLVVIHCERGTTVETIRIISARKATNHERNFYQDEHP